jgi:glutathione peroxidase
MQRIYFSVSLSLLLLLGMACSTANKQTESPTAATTTVPTQSFYDFKMLAIDGTEIDLSKYKGKKVLVVNTASKCGFTPQYKDLEALHQKMGDKLVILGFPANNFMGQEPGSNTEIASFCQKNYGVTFQMFEKIDVVGKNQHPLYKFLSDKTLNGWNDQAPSWNFCKYLIDENGRLIKFYKSGVNPLDDEILNAVNS